MKAIAEEYRIIVQNEYEGNLESTLDKHYKAIGQLLSKVIYEAGLIA